MPILTTERLRLRPFRPEDAADVYAYSKNPRVGQGAGWRPHASLEESRAIMAQLFLDQDGMWAITVKPDDKVIGSIGLVADTKRQNPAALMLGYVLGEEHWGQGIATEAARVVIKYGFEELALELVSVNCFPFNAGSQKVIAKCGFHYEGTLRQAERTYDGQVHDHLCYSLIRQEYQKNAGSFESAERAEAKGKISFARVVRTEYIREVVDMARRIWREYYGPLLPPGQVEYMLAKYQSEAAIRQQIAAGFSYFLIEYEGWSVGYSAARVENGRLYISKLYIYPDWRGKKLSSAVLEMYEGYCRANGMATIALNVNRGNENSIAIYEHLGFAKEKTQITDIGDGYVMDDYVMIKWLTAVED